MAPSAGRFGGPFLPEQPRRHSARRRSAMGRRRTFATGRSGQRHAPLRPAHALEDHLVPGAATLSWVREIPLDCRLWRARREPQAERCFVPGPSFTIDSPSLLGCVSLYSSNFLRCAGDLDICSADQTTFDIGSLRKHRRASDQGRHGRRRWDQHFFHCRSGDTPSERPQRGAGARRRSVMGGKRTFG